MTNRACMKFDKRNWREREEKRDTISLTEMNTFGLIDVT